MKVLDFGLVKVLGESTLSKAPAAASVLAGTPYYMAPELLLGHAASQASDVWALGVIAYEMLTRDLLFISDLATDRSKTIPDACFRQLHLDRSDLPVHLRSFFEQVFQWEPARRISSAGLFYSELELAMKGRNPATQTTR